MSTKPSRLLAVALVTGTAACTLPEQRLEPVVASFNEASVAIQIDGNALQLATEDARRKAFAAADAKAREICARGPNRKAEYASTRNLPTSQYSFVTERLYLCLK